MALSRSPIKLTKQVSVIVGLRNAMSILFLERISNPIKARSHSKLWKDHEKAVYVSVSQILFTNDLKEGPFSCLRWVFYYIQQEFILIGGIMHKFFQKE